MNSLSGHLLIATPELRAPLFARSVVLMIDHDEEGAMGVILNRPTDAVASDLPEEVVGEDFAWDKRLHLGGPVPGPLMLLHADPDLAGREVLPGVFLTLDAEKARALLAERAEPSMIVVNYSGWGPGQLEGEFGWDSWLTLPATAEHVFGPEGEDLWDAVVGRVHARKLSDFLGIKVVPPDPSLN
jgi:putative transcriptional regulator